MLEISQR